MGHWLCAAQPAGGRQLAMDAGRAAHGKMLRSRVTVNNAENYIGCCLAGLGMIQIPRFDIQHHLDGGELIEVLPDFRPPAMGIALLYPHRRQRSARFSVFADWFGQLIAPFCES
nr:LysR substrate-binding domain-containing protein [Serratia ficaria]